MENFEIVDANSGEISVALMKKQRNQFD